MAQNDTKDSSQSLDNRSFNPTFGMYEFIAYGANGDGTVGAIAGDPYPFFYASIEADGGYDYVETYNADDGWQILRINNTTGIADYASGSSGVATAWTNRASQTYALK